MRKIKNLTVKAKNKVKSRKGTNENYLSTVESESNKTGNIHTCRSYGRFPQIQTNNLEEENSISLFKNLLEKGER